MALCSIVFLLWLFHVSSRRETVLAWKYCPSGTVADSAWQRGGGEKVIKFAPLV